MILTFKSSRLRLRRIPWNASVKRRGERAIDINLISKLLFKSKQMDFIVKNYWQYVLRESDGYVRDVNGNMTAPAIIMKGFCRGSRGFFSLAIVGERGLGGQTCVNSHRKTSSSCDRVSYDDDDDTNRKLRHSSFAQPEHFFFSLPPETRWWKHNNLYRASRVGSSRRPAQHHISRS